MEKNDLNRIKMLCEDMIDEIDGDASFNKLYMLLSNIEMILDNSEDMEEDEE